MIIAGVDEAGRGPVLGPMVIAIASIDKKDDAILKEIGVKDSKVLSPKQRDEMFEKLLKAPIEYKIVKIPPNELDKFMDAVSLNEVEAMFTGRLINALKKKPERVYIDSPETGLAKYAGMVRKYLDENNTELVAENKADSTYPIVSAASILAKVTRDEEMKKLSEKHGEMGSGYPADPFTMKFLTDWVKEKGKLPDFARAKWETSKRVLAESRQRKLF